MTASRWLPVVLTASLLGGAAYAQTQSAPTGLHEAEDDAMIVQPFAISVEALEDMDVYGSAGEEIGEVEDVLVDASGQPVAVTADVGGFLGIGEREVVIGLDQLTHSGDRLTVGMTKEQIEALPEFADD
jgi:sporulation protein YlmC with PRC-barrel domain